jgi:hypothetical protein
MRVFISPAGIAAHKFPGSDPSEHEGLRRHRNGPSGTKCATRGPKPKMEVDVGRPAAAFEHELASKDMIPRPAKRGNIGEVPTELCARWKEERA